MFPLRKERLKRGLSMNAMAKLCKADPASYFRYELGTQKPRPETAEAIAQRLGNSVTRDQLLFPEKYEEEVEAAAS